MFDGYWEDIGTIGAFFEANLQLVSDTPPFQFGSANSPIYTRARFLPPTRLRNATITNALIADGCEIGNGSIIENSVVGLRCHIGPNVTIRNSIIMGADYYEETAPAGQPGIGIGDGSLIDGAIVDKLARIGRDVRVVNTAGITESDDHEGCIIRDSIPVVLKEATLPDGWRL